MLTFPYINTEKCINMPIDTFSKHINTATTADREKYKYKFTQTGRECQHTETFVHVITNTYTYMLFPTATQTHKHLQCTHAHTAIPVHRSRRMNLHCGVAKKGRKIRSGDTQRTLVRGLTPILSWGLEEGRQLAYEKVG